MKNQLTRLEILAFVGPRGSKPEYLDPIICHYLLLDTTISRHTLTMHTAYRYRSNYISAIDTIPNPMDSRLVNRVLVTSTYMKQLDTIPQSY
jgi:hypothetical protein